MEDSPTDPNDAATGKDTQDKIQFAKPPGLELPEGSQDGAEVEMVATFKIEGENLCLVAVEGMPVSGYDGDEAEPEAPEPTDTGNDFVDGMG